MKKPTLPRAWQSGARDRVRPLRYVSVDSPGCSRRRRGRRFAYFKPDGRPIRDPAEIRRMDRLAIPPAWTDVWISPSARGHIQATGRDARGRLQYRYHADWSAARDATKYDRMVDFGRALPARLADRKPRLTKRQIASVVTEVAGQLGNTPAICRKCYIHPALFADGVSQVAPTKPGRRGGSSHGFRSEEKRLLRFLGAHRRAHPRAPELSRVKK